MYSLTQDQLFMFLKFDFPRELKKKILDFYEQDVPDFWKPHLRRMDTLLISKHRVYIDQPVVSNFYPQFHGFGGRLFKITKGDQVFTSSNLWCLGAIPKTLTTVLQENCLIEGIWA